MNKGRLIGKGMTAEVYEWGQDRVLKLFFDRISEDWIKHEAENSCAVHNAGVSSPELFDMIDVDGHKGIILQRILGKSMLMHIQTEPWRLYLFAQQLARFHYEIHQYSADGLSSQKDRFIYTINRSSQLDDDKKNKILDYIDFLPNGKSICHGDFHFNNIIVSDNKLVAIDWSNAYQGNPLGDVARTFLMMSSPSRPHGTYDITLPFLQYTKQLISWTYLNEYMRLAKVKFENIDAWILPVAAAKLKDKLAGEQKWLVDIINKRLEHVNP